MATFQIDPSKDSMLARRAADGKTALALPYDVVKAVLVGGAGVNLTYNSATGKVTLSSSAVAGILSAGSYNAATNTLTLTLSDGSTVDVSMASLLADAVAPSSDPNNAFSVGTDLLPFVTDLAPAIAAAVASIEADRLLDNSVSRRHFATWADFNAAVAADVDRFQSVYVDDSGAQWNKVAAQPTHSCKKQIGTQWFELATHMGTVTPQMLGYVAGSNIDCTTTLNDLQTNPAVSRIAFGPGTYQLKNFRPRAGLTIEGVARNVSFFTHDGDNTVNTATNCVIWCNAHDFTCRHMGFIGTPYTVMGQNVGPTIHINIVRHPNEIRASTNNIRVDNCYFFGGYAGLATGSCKDSEFSNLIIEWQQFWGCTIVGGCHNVVARDMQISYTGGEGFKRGDDEDNFCSNITVSNIEMIGCGLTDVGVQNDAFDNFLRNGINCTVSDIRMHYCANGLSFKFMADADIPVNDLNAQMMLNIQNCYAHLVQPGRGIAQQFTGASALVNGRTRGMKIEGHVEYDIVTHECAVTNISVTAGSNICTVTTSVPHDLAPGDTAWPKMWTVPNIGGLSAAEVLRVSSVYTAPTANTFTFFMRKAAVTTESSSVGCVVWLWNRNQLPIPTDALSCTTGTAAIVLNLPRHNLAAPNEIELSGVAAFGGYSVDDLNGVFEVSAVAGDLVTLPMPFAATATVAAGGGSAITARRFRKATGARGILVQGWDDVIIKASVTGAYTGVSVNPTTLSAIQSTMNNLTIDADFMNCTVNVGLTRGTLRSVDIKMTGDAIRTALLGGTGLVTIDKLRATGTNFTTKAKRASLAAVDLNCVKDGLFKYCRIANPAGYAVRASATSGGGTATASLRFSECELESALEAVRNDAGVTTLERVNTRVPTTRRSYVLVGGSVTSISNCRGDSAIMPTGAGQVGDYYNASTPVAAGAMGWVCTTASAGAATWKAFGTIAP